MAISARPRATQNAARAVAYTAAIDADGLATVRGIAWSAIDRLRGDIISELMCHFEADLAALCNRHGAPLQALLLEVRRCRR